MFFDKATVLYLSGFVQAFNRIGFAEDRFSRMKKKSVKNRITFSWQSDFQKMEVFTSFQMNFFRVIRYKLLDPFTAQVPSGSCPYEGHLQ